jgi:prepilin-type processing-associated H-X9-DG protein
MDSLADGNRDLRAATSVPPPPLQFGLWTIFVVTAIAAALAVCGIYGGGVGFFVALLFTSVVLSQWFLWRRHRVLARLCDVLFFGSLIGIAYFLTPNTGSREFHRQGKCANNLKRLAMAIQEYETNHGSLPPVHSSDTAGKPLHSWRTLLLPYLAQEALFKRLHLDEPWDGSANLPLAQFDTELFHCLANDANPGVTDYVAVIAPGSVWSVPGGAKISDITDGPKNTILLVEMKNSGIKWAEPRDLDLNNLPPGITKQNLLHSLSNHASGFNAVFADGHVEFIREDIPWADFEAMLTIAGGEKVDRDKW